MTLENDLGKDQIKRLVLRLAIPAMLAQFINILYSIVDRIFVANIPIIGDDALSALGVCAPIITLIGSFSALVGVGGSTLMSIKLGEKKEKEAKDILSNAFLMLAVLSVVLMIGAFLVKKPMLYRFGISDTTYPYANEYLSYYLLGTVFAILSSGLNQFITCQGYAKKAMLSVVIGAVANIVLDPIFIFVFDLKVAGAAIATVIAQLLSCLYTLRFLLRKDIPVRLSTGGYQAGIMKRILTIGFTPFIIVATDNVILIAMNIALQKHGGAVRGDMLVACNAILQSFMSIVSMPLIGITSGTQPILGYNYGAKKTSRVMEAEKYTFGLALLYTTLLFVLAQTIPHVFVSIFSPQPEYMEVAVRAIRMYTLGLIPMAVQYTVVDGFTGIGKVRISITLSLFRKSIFLLCILIIPQFFDIMAIFYTESISDVIGGIASGIAFALFMRRILEEREMA